MSRPSTSDPSVRLELSEVPGGVEIVCTDNGLGVPETYRERLFGMFARFHVGFAEDSDQFLHRHFIHKHDPTIKFRAALDGQQALEALREDGYVPDLILLDINMPRMNGLEFLQAYVQEFEPGAAPVIVMLTSSLLPMDRERALSYAPVKGFLGKPLDVDWVDAVKQAMQS